MSPPPSLEGDMLRGRDKTFYSVRLIALCCAVSALVAGAVSIPVVFVLSKDASDRSYLSDLKSCARQNDGRRDLNKRLITQRRDARNLGMLASTMSEVRLAEARAFHDIGKAFHIEKQVKTLVGILKNASAIDKEIAQEQSEVRYKNAVIQDCLNKDVIPRP